jgi:diguanylate cyclase (GGDEF)-like protein
MGELSRKLWKNVGVRATTANYYLDSNEASKRGVTMTKAKLRRSISVRRYILPVIVIAAGFLLTDILLVRAIRGYFFQLLEKQSLSYAHIYSHSLTKSREAYDLLNDLLEDKLYSASGTTALYSAHMTSESLKELAPVLGVDDIFIYSPEGEIVHSNRDEYLGWQAVPGHPVHDFLISGATALVEDIREDTESGELFKYGYFRGEGGRFVQLGIKAGRVAELLESFELGYLFHELGRLELVDRVYFVDEDLTVIASDDPGILGARRDDISAIAALASGESYAQVNFDEDRGERVYEVYVPVYTGSERSGTLVISMSTSATQAVARIASVLALVAATVVFTGLVYILASNYTHSRELVSLAYEDSLTGLPNKAHLLEYLGEELAPGREGHRAIMMVHCRNLGAINSAYGFDVGDRAIRELGKRLRAFTNANRSLFHFATNRFVLYVRDYRGKEELAELAEQIKGNLERPLECVGRQIMVRTGILELGSGCQSAMEAVTRASVALHHAETVPSGHSFSFYDSGIEAQLQREEIIAREMAEFIASPEGSLFYLEYQPKVSLATGKIVGFEALARMESPSSGRVSPVEFIPIAERQDLIVPLGYWFLETACRFISQLYKAGYPDLHVAVNISVAQLRQEDFAERVKEIVERAGIKPENLELEITESVIIEDFSDIESKLCPLRDLGITIALDDFGTGYSALARLGELPIDSIKIDKRFIDSVPIESKQSHILEDLVSMCHKLDLEVVAEGVEHEIQRQYLATIACDIMQGYLYSKPLAEEAALAKLGKFQA